MCYSEKYLTMASLSVFRHVTHSGCPVLFGSDFTDKLDVRGSSSPGLLNDWQPRFVVFFARFDSDGDPLEGC